MIGISLVFQSLCFQDWTPEEALRFVVACGALSNQAAGGTQAQPAPEEALALLR